MTDNTTEEHTTQLMPILRVNLNSETALNLAQGLITRAAEKATEGNPNLSIPLHVATIPAQQPIKVTARADHARVNLKSKGTSLRLELAEWNRGIL